MFICIKLVSSVWKRGYELSVGVRVNDGARSKCADDQNRKLTLWTTVSRADRSFDDAGGQLSRQDSHNDKHRCCAAPAESPFCSKSRRCETRQNFHST